MARNKTPTGIAPKYLSPCGFTNLLFRNTPSKQTRVHSTWPTLKRTNQSKSSIYPELHDGVVAPLEEDSHDFNISTKAGINMADFAKLFNRCLSCNCSHTEHSPGFHVDPETLSRHDYRNWLRVLRQAPSKSIVQKMAVVGCYKSVIVISENSLQGPTMSKLGIFIHRFRKLEAEWGTYSSGGRQDGDFTKQNYMLLTNKAPTLDEAAWDYYEKHKHGGFVVLTRMGANSSGVFMSPLTSWLFHFTAKMCRETITIAQCAPESSTVLAFSRFVAQSFTLLPRTAFSVMLPRANASASLALAALLTALEGDGLEYTFRQNDQKVGIKRIHDTKVMGKFICSNRKRWDWGKTHSYLLPQIALVHTEYSKSYPTTHDYLGGSASIPLHL
ncbi:atp-dependent helicase [Fusarium bulbicola]|nr:atp-dependent helicase [Fusarium bulbicola]